MMPMTTKTDEQVCSAGIAALRLALEGSGIHYDEARLAVVRGDVGVTVWFGRVSGPAHRRVATDRVVLRVDGVRGMRCQSIVAARSFKTGADGTFDRTKLTEHLCCVLDHVARGQAQRAARNREATQARHAVATVVAALPLHQHDIEPAGDRVRVRVLVTADEAIVMLRALDAQRAATKDQE